MEYLALYRKYRPKNFDEVIGQDFLVQTLKNQIKNNRIGHAYLFCGVRGTGKTSTAKIFARAINCINSVDGSPCNECEVCKEMLKPSNMDIVEIDAASNNRVDEIRELREKVQYPPAIGSKKVYIIDEVHMLTDSAYNALLKTLEEPPSHAVFILATTEPHKLPSTILSRCMRFDFALVSDEELIKHLKKILDENKITYDEDSVKQIAKMAEGGVRDALSILDKCIAFSGDSLKYEQVLNILGASNSDELFKLARCILTKDIGGTFECTDSILKKGKSVTILNKDILKIMRDILVVKTVKKVDNLLTLPKKEKEELNDLASLTDEKFLINAVNTLSEIENELRFSLNARLVLESAFIKCISFSGFKVVENVTPSDAELKKKPQITEPEEFETDEDIEYKAKNVWGKILLNSKDNPYFYTIAKRIEPMLSGNDFILNVFDGTSYEYIMQDENRKYLKELFVSGGFDYKLKIVKNTKIDEKKEAVTKIKELFSGDKLTIIE